MKWDCHNHRKELLVSNHATVYHPRHGQLCVLGTARGIEQSWGIIYNKEPWRLKFLYALDHLMAANEFRAEGSGGGQEVGLFQLDVGLFRLVELSRKPFGVFDSSHLDEN